MMPAGAKHPCRYSGEPGRGKDYLVEKIIGERDIEVEDTRALERSAQRASCGWVFREPGVGKILWMEEVLMTGHLSSLLTRLF